MKEFIFWVLGIILVPTIIILSIISYYDNKTKELIGKLDNNLTIFCGYNQIPMSYANGATVQGKRIFNATDSWGISGRCNE